MKVGIYAGSFDPFHKGHENIARRAAAIFDEVIIAIGVHPTKKAVFNVQDRRVMIERTFTDTDRVTVAAFDSLLVNFVEELEEHDCHESFYLVRGLRDAHDFAGESRLAFANRDIATNQNETVFILTDPSLSHISSTLIRELLKYERACFHYLPDPVADLIEWRREHPGTILLDNVVREMVSD